LAVYKLLKIKNMVPFRARKHGKAIEIAFINGNTKWKEWR